MKKFLILITVLFSITLFSIKIGYYENNLLTFNNKETPSGVLIDLMEKVSKENNIRIDWVYDTLPNLLKKLKNNEVDGVILIKKNFLFSIKDISILFNESNKYKDFLNLIDEILQKYKVKLIERYNNLRYIYFIVSTTVIVLLLMLLYLYLFRNKTKKEILRLKTIVDQIPVGLILHDRKKLYYKNKLFCNISKEKGDSLETLLKKLNLNDKFKETLLDYSNKKNELVQKINGIYYKVITINLYSHSSPLFLTLFENLNEIIEKETKLMKRIDIDVLEEVFDLVSADNYDYEAFTKKLFKSILKKNIADFFGLGVLEGQKLNLNVGMSDGRVNKVILRKEEKTVSWFALNKNIKLYIPNNLEWHEEGYSIKIKDKTLVGKPSTLYVCPIKFKNTEGIVIFGKVGINMYSEMDIHLLNILLKQITFAINYNTLLKSFYEEKERYKKMALMDPLTNLYTRYFFNGWILHHYEKLRRNHQTSAIVMIDVDNFKFINDKYGHIVGDKVLKSIAKVILTNVRRSDLASRFGGDEFIIIFDDFDFNQAKERMNLIQRKLFKLNYDFKITISYGISIITKEKDWMKTLKEADMKMYQMKNSNKK